MTGSRMIGDDGELLADAPPPHRKRRWVLLAGLVSGLLLAAVVMSRPAESVFYWPHLAETEAGDGAACGTWTIIGFVDHGQPTMTIRAWFEDMQMFSGRVHGDHEYMLMLNPSPQPQTVQIGVFDGGGQPISDSLEYRFVGDTICGIRVDFNRVQR